MGVSSVIKGLVAIVLLSIAWVPGSRAAMWRLDGTVTEIRDGASLFSFPVTLGTPFSILVTLTGTPLDDEFSSNRAVGYYGNGVAGMQVTVGDTTLDIPFEAAPFSRTVWVNDNFVGTGVVPRDEWTADMVGFSSAVPLAPAVGYLASVSLAQEGPAPTLTASDLFQGVPGNWELANRRFMVLQAYQDTSFSQVTASITAVQPVPLPAAAWMLLSGCGAVGALARRRRLPGVDGPGAMRARRWTHASAARHSAARHTDRPCNDTLASCRSWCSWPASAGPASSCVKRCSAGGSSASAT